MAHLLCVAAATPARQADLAMATEHAQAVSCRSGAEARKVEKLYQRTGVETRGSVLLEERTDGTLGQTFYPPLTASAGGPTTSQRNARFVAEAPGLAAEAAAEAIRKSGCGAEQITHLLTVTCTGFHSPGIDVELIDRLALRSTTQRIQIGFMGCHALINALRTARGLVAAEPGACVLISSVELCSLHYQYGYDAQRIVSGSLFADGAAGMIVVGEELSPSGNLESRSRPLGEIAATGSCLIPASRDAMTWSIGDHGFVMTLAASVPGLIESQLAEYLIPWLSGQGETLDSIGGWAVHPGGVRILQAVEKALDLAPERLALSRHVLRSHGNMSSATLAAVLQSFQREQVALPWLMLGFGPGLEIEVALIR